MTNLNLGDTALIIAECKKFGLSRVEAANVLAQAFWETAGKMKPIREMGGEAYLKKKKYYPYVGMGYVQLTWLENYQDWSKRIGVDFVKNPRLLLVPEYSARILVEGMKLGTFTKKKLSSYLKNGIFDHFNARDIVNGDKNKKIKESNQTVGQRIVQLAEGYDKALQTSGYDSKSVAKAEAKAEKNSVLKRGDRGKYVEDLQKNLKALGYVLDVDGVFGRSTETSVRAFQVENRLLVDGKAGIRTITAIGEALKALETKPQIEAAKKEIPKTVETVVKEKTSWFSKIVALVTGSGVISSLGINNWFDSDWTTILAWIGGILGAGVVLVLLFLLLGSQVMSKIDEINSRQR